MECRQTQLFTRLYTNFYRHIKCRIYLTHFWPCRNPILLKRWTFTEQIASWRRCSFDPKNFSIRVEKTIFHIELMLLHNFILPPRNFGGCRSAEIFSKTIVHIKPLLSFIWFKVIFCVIAGFTCIYLVNKHL